MSFGGGFFAHCGSGRKAGARHGKATAQPLWSEHVSSSGVPALAPTATLGHRPGMIGRIAALHRHPVKGFTPERLTAVVLAAGAHFPCDRIFCVENGPSGFDPAQPAHLSKMRFTVLARIPALARIRTAYDEATGRLTVEAPGRPPLVVVLTTAEGRAAFEAWLTAFVAEHDPQTGRGPLKVLAGSEGGHRFMDSRKGFVSLLNLASVRDLERRLGRPVDPARFRANIWVEGLPAWAEAGRAGQVLHLGQATLTVLADIDRCAAVHVDPTTGEKDIDLVPELFALRGDIFCGVYAEVSGGGRLAVGDDARAA
jgi:uncharacterized protein YcbX